ncbi:MAG: hypothetical protein WD690_00880 [Vicinamibacterales bacterium]
MALAGVLFEIDALGGGYYSSKAWRFVMKHISPSRLLGCHLMEGDTAATLAGRANEFCVAFSGAVDVDYVKEALVNAEESGLRPRVCSPDRLEMEPLVRVGSIDELGRFTEESWSRSWHDRCREAGWGYKPEQVPEDLPPELRGQLDALMGGAGRP